MTRFEAAYQDWLAVQSGADTTNRAARLVAFRDVLFTLKNVYPVQKLADCTAPEDQPKFILGQTALGSADTRDQ
jgi:hypothetical protein